MSGAAGGTRIPRSAVEQTVKDYTEKILSKIEGFKDAKLSGSFNRPDKDDFGDIDIVVTIETGDDKKIAKKKIMDLFATLPDNELPPLRNPKYKGKKAINHGEMVSNLYPISGMPGEFVQVDNIIALSSEEGSFKKTVLDYPAELQGIILGLVKTPLLEEKPEVVFARMGIKDIPEPGPTQEYEFHIDTAGLTLRLVTYGDNYKILDSNTVWQSRNFADVEKLLKDFNLDGSFRELIEQVKNLKNPRSKNRVKGFFKRSIKVGAAERGTPKGDVKQQALDTVDTLQESKALLTRAKLATKYLDEDEKSRIAVFPGAFKPPHKDHIARINAASKKVGENGKVLVLVSPLPRTKEGQESISAEQTIAVFNLYKDKGIIPNNVAYRIADDNSPITAAYKEFESDKTQPYIAVFGKDDKARFSNIEDKLPNVVVDSFEEAGVGNASATDLRTAIANRDKETITTFIPAEVTAEEYLNTLGVKEPIEEDASTDTNLWEPHAAMLAKIEKKPELLKGLWKSLSKPSRKALVLYFREKNTQVENVIPAADEKAAPYGSGYTPVEESLWANINAKKKRGEKPSHGNSNAFKAAKKAGAALKKTKGLEEGSGEKKLRVFDFDDTLVHVDATIYITHKDGTKSGLTPAEYAVYVPQEGDLFNFSEFSSVIKKAKPLESNIADLIKSYNDPTEKTTILTARLLGYPVKKYLKDEFNIEPYVIGLGSSDPEDKSRWIESQIKKGYNNIEFRDDSQKNVDAVASLKDKYPEVELTSTLVAEGVESISPKLTINENASYSKNIDIKYKIAELAQHMIDKGMNVQPLPSVEFINGNSKNAEEFLGKTAYYDPAVNRIVLYTEGRHPKDIVRSFAHEMIHHIQNLEGRLDNITTANTLEDSNLNDIEAEANLKGTMTFRNWTDSLNESNTIPELQKEKVNISFELFDGTKISEDITLAMSSNSQGLFELGDNIEKYSGLTLKDAQEFNETPDDAYIYGLVNTMNDGRDIFFWTNGTRLVGNAKRIGTQTAIIEQLAHEGLHLTRAILAKSLMGDKFPTEEWPSIGEQDNDRIEEEQLTTALSHVLEKISAPFIEMASKYIPELNPTPVQPNTADSLNEIGDAKHTPYRWTKSISTTRMGSVRTLYKFKTSLDTPYQVDYGVTLGGDKSLMGFRVEHESFNQVTNKGEMFEVMSTVIDTTKDFLQNNPEVNQLTIEPTKNNGQDNRRAKLYNSYVEKNIPKGWSFTSNNDEIVLSRDDVGTLKEVMQSVTDDMVVVLSREDNALDLYDTVTKESLGYINVYQNEVTGVASKKGYGPLMYELGMAYVYPKPLRSDRNGNTEQGAQTIWEKFIEGVNPNIKVVKLTPRDEKFATHYPNESEIWEPENNFYNYEFYNPNKSQVDELITKGSLLTKEEQEHIIKVGDEFYHKLVRENKHTPTLNKDPFGLNAYARELAMGLEEVLINEGMYDTMTNQISSEIFKAWKEQFNKKSSIKKASFEKSYDLLNKKGRSIVFNLEADLNFIETEESIYSPDGNADAGESEIYDDEGNVEDTGIDATISLFFQVDPRTLPKLWSTISMDLKDIVRHEIEHLTQSGYNVIASKELPDDQALRHYIENLKILPYSNYYLLDKEIPAMLQGMYFKAKKMKKPFKDVLNDYLDIFVNNETIDKEDKADILNRWRVAAQDLNLPSF
jgi:predicted nucleotidyltransferase